MGKGILEGRKKQKQQNGCTLLRLLLGLASAAPACMMPTGR